jgi:hypothetical protein
MLRKVFGPKLEEVTGEWRRLHDEELDGLFWCKTPQERDHFEGRGI